MSGKVAARALMRAPRRASFLAEKLKNTSIHRRQSPNIKQMATSSATC